MEAREALVEALVEAREALVEAREALVEAREALVEAREALVEALVEAREVLVVHHVPGVDVSSHPSPTYTSWDRAGTNTSSLSRC